jgi:DNA-directed RNA polymerase specialized sigma24 family protein
MFFHDQIDVRRFYDRWGPTVLRYCQLSLGDQEQAESAMREAFVGFFKGTPDLKSGELPVRLMQLAVAASRSRCLTPGEHNGAEGLEACVRLLPFPQRSVFLMRGTFNLAASEVAEITDTTVNEVSKLWLDALLNLRRWWLKKS